jgi:hypothetical protein
MILINFSHPLTAPQRAAAQAVVKADVIDERHVPASLNVQQAFGPQVAALADEAGLTPAQWQGAALLLVLPSLNYAAAALLAEVHGRCGYWPPVLRLRPVAGPDGKPQLPPSFEFAEVINLAGIREDARARRF